ncbi:OmpA/MotB domain protein [Thiorhodococcus drewsii AZ1]|uniref:OmpA/MotB domain protein n=1 Tax=Thiorhodococcus drewsii AZ1 TaxID=765913 RepID=G2DZU8_9GAMM|nr:OmpA family protein [Thiorhodococcus drewsii]EGV31987.1 OmpA/MotB domain protein [Thiorhodococcus drewsii AZ1]
MSDSSTSFWKLIAIFLFIALTGVYSLYEWYDDQLKAEIAEKDAQIAQSLTEMHDADARRMHSEEVEESIRTQIQSLNEQHKSEIADLSGQIAGLKQDKTALEQAMEGLKADQAQALENARQKTAKAEEEKQALVAANTELEKLYESTHERAITLKGQLDKVDQVIAKTEEEHRAKIAELEQHLNERVNLARTTPMDENLVRTAQEIGVLPKSEDEDGVDLQALIQQLDEAHSKLDALTSEHEATREQLAEAQAKLEQTETALEQTKAELVVAQESAQGDAGQASEEMATQLAELNARLASEQEVRAALQEQHDAAIAALQTSLDEAKSRLSASKQELEQTRATIGEADAALKQRLEEAQARVASLEADLEQEKGKVAETQDGAQAELDAMREKLALLEAELAQARESGSEIDETTAQRLVEAQTRIAALEEGLETARKEVMEKDAAITEKDEEILAREAAARRDAEAQIAKLRALYSGYAEMGGTYTPQGVLVRLAESELRFSPGQAELPAAKLPSLDRVAELLAKQPDLRVRVEGHTDSSGGENLNLSLSKRRAEAVRQALVSLGVSADRISAEGVGSERPIATNATAHGRSLNRRVEIYLLD